MPLVGSAHFAPTVAGTVLIAGSLAEAILGMHSLSGVVALVVTRSEPTLPGLGVPCVTGVPFVPGTELTDALIVVDGDKGVVLIDPEPAEIAAYQADRIRLAPRLRYHLGVEHDIARTTDGWTVLVGARCATSSDLELAIDAGADVLYVDATSAHCHEIIETVCSAGPGKPLMIQGSGSLSADRVGLLALRCDLTLVSDTWPAGEEGAGPSLRIRHGLLLVGTYASLAIPPPACVVISEGDCRRHLREGAMAWATEYLVTAYVYLGADGPTGLSTAIGCMATGVLVLPSQVPDVKDAIRRAHAGECRATELRDLSLG